MFCQNCGAKQAVDSKFCQGCGKPILIEVNLSPQSAKTIEPLQEKVFLNQGGILVSDVVFKTNGGASYPIRNISSVSVATIPPNRLVQFMAVALTVLGFFCLLASVTASLIVLAISAPFWYWFNYTSHLLRIGAGGVIQTAIQSADANQLNTIANAINDSILYIQRRV